MALLLVAVLSVEALTMTEVYRHASMVGARQQLTVDPGQFFQSF